ncbi:hypothetical protein DCAR_0830985 [Daucus carota subsp. sativus]|uniref:Uncharacterized protein n=1 Tax=Daucus carota subsp. sativus TaxID=79200 RepID=A0AAF1BB79_DAUCS|nr:hypothetical protein DCAR_0830985 [Daucus carota subsp. sativus]
MRKRSGQIKITEEIVQKTIGLPRGSEKILYRNAKGAFDLWGKQFPDVKVCKVTPKMVRGELVSSDKADENFKFNFLVMVYNFFIENNQGRYVLRDMVRFAGDIDNCGKYNWCGLLVDKLKKTHRYWVEAKKRNFTGPLPFLIYLYVSRVVNKETTRVPLKTPAYYGWSDMLLKERQNYELKNSCFGYGEILEVST